MTLDEIREMVVSVDRTAGHYESAHRAGQAYTVWREYGELPFTADGRSQGAVSFQVDRFTRDENDAVARALFQELDKDDRIAMEYRVDYEQDTRYIHHIFDCEGY